MGTQECIKVLVPGNGNKISIELARQLQPEVNIQIEHADIPEIFDHDVYVVIPKDDGSIVENIRKQSPNASIFIILCTDEACLLKKLLSLRIDGIIDAKSPKYQPVVECIKQRAESMNGLSSVYLKLKMLEKMQRLNFS